MWSSVLDAGFSWILWIVCTYGLLDIGAPIVGPLALLVCLWIAKIDCRWCKSSRLIPIVEIILAITLSLALPSFLLYGLVLPVYCVGIIASLYFLFLSHVLIRIVSTECWMKIAMVAFRHYVLLQDWYRRTSSYFHTALLCRIAISALDCNCANTRVLWRCVRGANLRPRMNTLHQLVHPQLPQLPQLSCEEVYIAFKATLLDKNNIGLLQQFQSIVTRVAIANQTPNQLVFSLTLFSITFDHGRSIEIIDEIQSKHYVVPPPLQFMLGEAWQFPLDHAIETVLRDLTDHDRKLTFTFVKQLLDHYGIKSLHQPHSTMEYALEQDAAIAKYLILNSTIRTWIPRRYRLFELAQQSGTLWLHTCLSPADIEELYDHQVDIRYLIRITIRARRWGLQEDGGEVLHRKFINHKQIAALAQIQLRQLPAELVSLFMSYV